MEDKLENLSLKELRKKVINLGMSAEDAELFGFKKPLIATIKAFSKQEPSGEDFTQRYNSKVEIMRKKLMKQQKVRIKLPLDVKEKPGKVKWLFNPKTKRKEQVYFDGAFLAVQLNGFKWIVPKGVYTEVPQQIADTIDEADRRTQKAGEEWLINRDGTDPETGKSVRETLSGQSAKNVIG